MNENLSVSGATYWQNTDRENKQFVGRQTLYLIYSRQRERLFIGPRLTTWSNKSHLPQKYAHHVGDTVNFLSEASC